MRKSFACAGLTMLAILVISLSATAQGNQGQGQGNQGNARPAGAPGRANQANQPRSPWKFYPQDRPEGDGGPAPKRDLSGTWAGPSSGMAVPRGTNAQDPTGPAMTALGQQMFALNKPIGKFSPAGTNDPHSRYCDPFGFPQNMTNEIRGMTLVTTPSRTFIMLQYMSVWREIWTDGRALPPSVGVPGKDVLDPKYNGYSIGRWEDDSTFVVDTTGLSDATWTTKGGYPHTVEAVVHERYHRDSKNDLTLTITMDDPKLYTKAFDLGTEHFRWVPNQQLDDFTCIPSEIQEYLQTMGDPAGYDPNAPNPGRGGAPAGAAGGGGGRGGRGGRGGQ